MADFSIRDAVEDDAVAIETVRAYTWKTTYSGLIPDAVLDSQISNIEKSADKRIRPMIASGHKILVAESEGKIVGFAGYGASRLADYPDDGELHAIYVLARHQGHGIGRALFERASAQLRDDGYAHFAVCCLVGNPSASFYGKMGGVPVKTLKRQIAVGEIEETVFRFALS